MAGVTAAVDRLKKIKKVVDLWIRSPVNGASFLYQRGTQLLELLLERILRRSRADTKSCSTVARKHKINRTLETDVHVCTGVYSYSRTHVC